MAAGGVSMTSGVAAPYLTTAVRTPAEGIIAVPSTTAEPVDKTAKTAQVDTVVISNKVQETNQEPRKEMSVKKEIHRQISRQITAQRKMEDILFLYNLRGDLRIRFMDSSNMLVYQTPPVMFSKMMDLMQNFGSFVSAKV